MERLAAMGEMALELAHEIRNPLGGLRLHVRFSPGRAGSRRRRGAGVEQVQVGVHTLEQRRLQHALLRAPARRPIAWRRTSGPSSGRSTSFLEPLTRERGVQVALELVPLEPAPFLDESQVRQVLLNLWLNALNAMPRGGRLDIAVRADGASSVELEFSDNGPGLPPNALERVFDPFFSADRRGTGLGLAVASQLVEANGGKHSRRERAGTRGHVSHSLSHERWRRHARSRV